MLRHQGRVLGPVTSPPTVWRALDELTPTALGRVEKARATADRHVVAQLPSFPASKVAGTDLGAVVMLDVDATLVTAHSEKEFARPTFKGSFGYHPIRGSTSHSVLILPSYGRRTPACRVTDRGVRP